MIHDEYNSYMFVTEWSKSKIGIFVRYVSESWWMLTKCFLRVCDWSWIQKCNIDFSRKVPSIKVRLHWTRANSLQNDTSYHLPFRPAKANLAWIFRLVWMYLKNWSTRNIKKSHTETKFDTINKAIFILSLSRHVLMNSLGSQSIYRWTIFLLEGECIAKC